MGQVVVRASKDDGSPYLLWSTNTDCPVYYFADRGELLEHLRNEETRRFPGMCSHGPDTPEARVQRADERGSSMMTSDLLYWDDEEIIFGEGMLDHPSGSYWFLLRESLGEYVALMLAGDDNAAYALLSLGYWDD